VDYATRNNIAVTVFILSPTGDVVHAHRMYGQVPFDIETAELKARSVLYTRDSSHARVNAVAGNTSLQLRWSKLPVFPTSGGLPIIADGQVIGAIGVGGSNKDEECTYESANESGRSATPVSALRPRPIKSTWQFLASFASLRELGFGFAGGPIATHSKLFPRHRFNHLPSRRPLTPRGGPGLLWRRRETHARQAKFMRRSKACQRGSAR
jgi:glc operon protein GlcG